MGRPQARQLHLPLVLAGGLGGTLKTGRTLELLKESDDNRKMCSLYLSLMDRLGIKLDQFGDSETRLQASAQTSRGRLLARPVGPS